MAGVFSHPQAAGLNIKQQSGIQKCFAAFDKNSDGGIGWEDLLEVLTDLGDNATKEDCEKFIKQYDADNNGLIDFNEFMTLFTQQLESGDTENDVNEAFKVFDKEGTGFIPAAEIRRVMTNLGDKLTDEEVDQMIRLSDFDGDGHVNYEEFTKIMLRKPESPATKRKKKRRRAQREGKPV